MDIFTNTVLLTIFILPHDNWLSMLFYTYQQKLINEWGMIILQN